MSGIFAKPNRNRPEPLWHQAEQAMRTLISSGEWATGAQIPNEERLCDLLGVSRITVRHALRNLEDSGLLSREHGRGTFVRSPTVIAGVRGLTSFTQEMANLGLNLGTRLLDARIIAADAQVAGALEIEEGTPVLQLRRLRLGNDQPIGIQTAHLPAARVPGLLETAASVSSLYETLKASYGIVPQEAREIYRIGEVKPEDAELIQLKVGSSAFMVERIAFDRSGPFEFTVSTMRGDRYEIRSVLHL
nr:GntR family transcriptional regulator [Aminobacter aminovorans]